MPRDPLEGCNSTGGFHAAGCGGSIVHGGSDGGRDRDGTRLGGQPGKRTGCGRGGRRLGDLGRGRALGGNSNGNPARVDALGPAAYYDNASNSAETTRGCHRSESAEIHIDVALSGNLACSGARTYTQPYVSGSNFKPGLDFYDDGRGHIGQAKALEQYARTHNVKLVVVLIGANNFGFASVVQRCMTNWLTSPTWWKNYCHDDASVAGMFTPAYIAQQRSRVIGAFENL